MLRKFSPSGDFGGIPRSDICDIGDVDSFCMILFWSIKY